jgi:hypothetical protein
MCGHTAVILAAVITALCPCHGFGLQVPSEVPGEKSGIIGGGQNEVVIAFDESLAVILVLAVAAAGNDREKAEEYAVIGLGVWLIWMTLAEYRGEDVLYYDSLY